ncbi:MAG: restriction endonuclease [Actinoplanes sp.]
MAGRRLPDRVADLMRAGGWRRVTITAAMGHLGTDVVGVGADGRRWLIRCHDDPGSLQPLDVQRFAETTRKMRRSEVTIMVTGRTAAEPVLLAARQARITMVDSESLDWWAAVQQPVF